MISQTAEYALRAIVFLARDIKTPYTTEQISKGTMVPPAYLSKVLQSLSKARLVQSQRGLGGGFSLLKQPDKLTILTVINAVDPIRRIESCPLGFEEHTSLCPLHDQLDRAVALIEDAFRSTTIDQLIAKGKKSNFKLCIFPEAAIESQKGK